MPLDSVRWWQGLQAELDAKMHEITYAFQIFFAGDTPVTPV